MSAKTDLYQEIKNKLLSETDVVHCRLYNSQIDNLEQENTFPFPAVFIEFNELVYSSRSTGGQVADCLIRLHVCFESLATEDLEILTLMDSIQLALQGFGVGGVFSSLNRSFEGQDVNHDIIIVWLMDYETRITDNSGHRNNKLTETTITDAQVIVDTSTEVSKPWLKKE